MKKLKDLRIDDFKRVKNSYLQLQFYYDFGNDIGVNITKNLDGQYEWSFKSNFFKISDNLDYISSEKCLDAMKLKIDYLADELIEIVKKGEDV